MTVFVHLGHFLVRIICRCGAVRECEPEALARCGSSATLEAVGKRMRCSSALQPFAITVTTPPVTTGSATVSLTPPTLNTDGSALTDLAGTIIHYGTSPSTLSQTVQVPGTAPSSYTISSLASGTWYFGAVAYTTAGTQSAMSSLVSTTIP